jgi:hypothetical protein
MTSHVQIRENMSKTHHIVAGTKAQVERVVEGGWMSHTVIGVLMSAWKSHKIISKNLVTSALRLSFYQDVLPPIGGRLPAPAASMIC